MQTCRHGVLGPTGEVLRLRFGRAGKLRVLSGERITSVDVARRVGVSQSTVSLVFSGKAPDYPIMQIMELPVTCGTTLKSTSIWSGVMTVST